VGSVTSRQETLCFSSDIQVTSLLADFQLGFHRPKNQVSHTTEIQCRTKGSAGAVRVPPCSPIPRQDPKRITDPLERHVVTGPWENEDRR
jgi:hypothetical protein